MNERISGHLLEAFMHCRLKGYLRDRGEAGTLTEYARVVADERRTHREAAKGYLLTRYPAAIDAQGQPASGALLARGPALLIDVVLENDLVSLTADALQRVSRPGKLGDFHYRPVLFADGETPRPTQRLILDVLALILGELQGRRPDKGIIVDGKKSASIGVILDPRLRDARALLEAVKATREADKPPPLTLINHCRVCEYQARCEAQARATDDISLLRGLREKEIDKLRQRGLTTVTQLAYTFRPRRTRAEDKRPLPRHSFALQALALRENKVYVLGEPALPDAPARVYFDIEGDPRSVTAYLLGMLVDNGSSQAEFSFWTDDDGGESEIVDRFLDTLERLGDYRLFCYGHFEIAFLRRMKQLGWAARIDPVLERTTNVLSVVYPSVYFPVYSNGLKDVAGHLGFHWTDPDASGLQCVAWRKRWEHSREPAVRGTIERYNLDDCAALRAVAEFVRRISAHAAQATPEDPGGPSVPFTRVGNAPRAFKKPDWGAAKHAIADFEYINDLAYFDYQRDRVYVRGRAGVKRRRPKRADENATRKLMGELRAEIHCRECPTCGGRRLVEKADRRLYRIVFDLKVTSRGIRRRYIRVTSPRYRCLECDRAFTPPEFLRVDHHSHALKSWAMNEHIVYHRSFGQLVTTLREYFGMRINAPTIHQFKPVLARYYDETYDRLLAKIVGGRLIHADETEVTVRNIGKAYVWVFTNLEEVVYVYRPNREGAFLHDLLRGFRGVLISDFYSVYDSLSCPQQKCLIHLIRDFNNDIVAHPFDGELKGLAAGFGRVLREAVATIDRYGLSRRHLGKHRRAAERLLAATAAAMYRSDVARAYQERFEKNRDKLFTFLDHDGVPWNNNNAEHAIKVFAKYREIADGMVTETTLRDHLILLSIYQTCAYKGVSFFRFLLSRERDVDEFRRHPGRKPVTPVYDLYPEGYVPSRRRPARRPATEAGQAVPGADG